jgi:phage tail sheath protein FI
MPEYLAPGVYVEEVEIGGKPIEGVSTSTAGFLGEAERGPIAPRLVTGMAQFERLYGGYSWKTEKGAPSTSFLPYAVAGFFSNGGKRCYIGRILGDKSVRATATLGARGTLTVSAIGPGSWGNRIGLAVRRASLARKEQTVEELFKLVVYYWPEPPVEPVVDPDDPAHTKDTNRLEPTAREEFDNLTLDPASPDYFVKRLHGNSSLIEAQEQAPATTTTTTAAATDKPEKPPTKPEKPALVERAQIQLLKGGKDGADLSLDSFEGDADTPSGLAAFVDLDDVSIVCIPNEGDLDGLSDLLISHCELMKDRFAVLQAKRNAEDIAELYPVGGKTDSKYAAFYYPWIEINDPVNGMPRIIPPGGHVAGIYARTDTERGVHKAPANERVRGVNNLQFNINKGDQDILNPRGVNCLRAFPGRGILVWGARTTSTDPLWKYVNVRRLFIFLEKSIERSTQWVVFEPNNERLWSRVRQSVSDFLMRVWKDGALVGATPEQAFFVKCDETVMTPNDLETGRLIVLIGVAPARPAEFVIFRLSQWRGGTSISE